MLPSVAELDESIELAAVEAMDVIGRSTPRNPVWRLRWLADAATSRLRQGDARHLPAIAAIARGILADPLGLETGVGSQTAPEPSNAGLFAHAISAPIWHARAVGQRETALDDLLELAGHQVRAFVPWIESEGKVSFMRSRIDGRLEPFNHVASWAAAAFYIADLTGEHDLRDAASRLLDAFEACTSTDIDAGTAWWPYRPVTPEEPAVRGEPIWKATTSLLLPIAAATVGARTATHIAAVYPPMFLHRVCSGSYPDGRPKFMQFIGNSKSRPLERRRLSEKRQHRVTSLAAFAVLGRFDARVDEHIVDAVLRRPDLFPDGWLGDLRTIASAAEIGSHTSWPKSG